MRHIFNCRRTFIAVLAIVCLAGLGYYAKDIGVAIAISTVAVGLAGANAYSQVNKKNGINKK
jgi:hypothetical protein